MPPTQDHRHPRTAQRNAADERLALVIVPAVRSCRRPALSPPRVLPCDEVALDGRGASASWVSVSFSSLSTNATRACLSLTLRASATPSNRKKASQLSLTSSSARSRPANNYSLTRSTNFAMRSMAIWSCSSEVAKQQRRNPSPLGPKALPGTQATFSS